MQNKSFTYTLLLLNNLSIVTVPKCLYVYIMFLLFTVIFVK